MRGGEVAVERRRRKKSERKADFRGLQSHFKRQRKKKSAPAAPRPMGLRARSIPVFVPS